MTKDELKIKYCMDGIYDVENRNVGGRWVKGLMEGYDYEVLVFPKGSQYGINKGRISKLNIRNKDKKTVAEYERGWTVKPKDAEGQRILKKVIALYPGK